MFAVHYGPGGLVYLLAFEIKTTDSTKSRRKAYLQLNKDKHWLEEKYGSERFWGFYVAGDRQGGYTIIRK